MYVPVHSSNLHTGIMGTGILWFIPKLIAKNILYDIETLRRELSKTFEISDCCILNLFLWTSVEHDQSRGVMQFDQSKNS